MEVALLIFFGVSTIAGAEFFLFAQRKKQPINPLSSVKKIFHGRDTFNAADGFFASILIGLISLLFLIGDTTYLQSSLLLTEEKSSKSAMPFVSNNLVALYENDVFGSTIDKIVIQKTFFPDPQGEEIVPDTAALSGEALRVLPEKEGVFYTTPPSLNQFAGDYKVRAHLRRGWGNIPPDEPVARLRVQQFDRSLVDRVIYARELPRDAKYRSFAASYSLAVSGAMPEISLSSFGTAELYFDRLEIDPKQLQIDPDEVPDTFPDVVDAEASEGGSRLAEPDLHLPGTMAFGPYDASLPAGKYTALFYIKVPELPARDARIARLQTTNIIEGTTNQMITSADITTEMIQKEGAYYPYGVPIEVTEDGTVEFRVVFFDEVKLLFDRVELYASGTKWDDYLLTSTN